MVNGPLLHGSETLPVEPGSLFAACFKPWHFPAKCSGGFFQGTLYFKYPSRLFPTHIAFC